MKGGSGGTSIIPYAQAANIERIQKGKFFMASVRSEQDKLAGRVEGAEIADQFHSEQFGASVFAPG